MRSLGQFARVEELREMLLEIDVDGEWTEFHANLSFKCEFSLNLLRNY